MSKKRDTPRTHRNRWMLPGYVDCWVPAYVAEELERELAAMTANTAAAMRGLEEALAHARHELSEHGRQGAMFDYGEMVEKLLSKLEEVKKLIDNSDVI